VKTVTGLLPRGNPFPSRVSFIAVNYRDYRQLCKQLTGLADPV